MKGSENKMGITRSDVLAVVRDLGAAGASFQFRDVREKMGITVEEKLKSARVYNLFASLEKDGITAEVSSGRRKRHKYYVIRDLARLNSDLAPQSRQSDEGSSLILSPKDKISRIEITVHSIQEQMDRIEKKMDRLLEIWA